MTEMYKAMVDAISANVQKPASEYMGADGFLHCSVCKAQTQTRVVVEALGINKVVRCVCDCVVKQQAEEEMRRRQEEFDRKRRICFAETNMAGWTFENDDRKNEKLSDAMQKYADNFGKYRKECKGLLLHGTVGTGKTYFAACIANRLIDNGYDVLMTNFARLANQIQGSYEKQKVIDDLNEYHLVVIDDLGAERTSEYMQEMVFNIIDSRYRSGLPFIITTNLPMEEIKKPQNRSSARIYDRILQRCFPVEVSGSSRRRQEVKDTYLDMKNELGL